MSAKRWKITTHHVGASQRVTDSRYRFRWQASLRVWLGGRQKAAFTRARIEREWPDWYVKSEKAHREEQAHWEAKKAEGLPF